MGLLVGGKTLVVANAGDSRCVVSRKGEAVDMSTDHKPEDDVELARIEKAGGAVVDGRVQVSRPLWARSIALWSFRSRILLTD